MLSHYPALLAWGYEQRFFAARHLPLRFPQHVRSLRTARYQCQQLVANGYLGEVPIRGIDPTFEKIFVTLSKGLAVVSDVYEQRTGRPWTGDRGEQLRAARGYGLPFIRHEILTTDVSTYIWQMAHGRSDIELGLVQRRYHRPLHRLTYDHSGMAKWLEPDAGYAVVRRGVDGRRWFEMWFLEADRGTMRLEPSMREKFAAYGHWAESGQGQSYLRRLAQAYGDRKTAQPNFRLLVVVQHRAGERDDWWRLVKLFTQGMEVGSPIRKRTWFATASSIRRGLAKRQIHQPIWYRLRDGATWFDKQKGESTNGVKWRFVAGQLARERRWSLLPRHRDETL